MTVRTIAIALLMFTLSCGGDDKKDEQGKAGEGGDKGDKKDGDEKGGGTGGGSGMANDMPAPPAGPAGAAPARSLFGGKFAGVFGKATEGAKPQTAGDLTSIFGSKLPTLTPALAGMGVAGAPGQPSAAPAAPAPGGGPAAALWAFAPPDAAFGVVAADGSLAEVAQAMATMSKTAQASPDSALIMAEMMAELQQLGVDPSNPAAWAQTAGMDLTKGFAMFASTAGNVVVVLPVTDVAAFRKAVKDDDDLDDKHCVSAGGRYICAPQLDYAQAAAAPHDSPLAKRAAQLPAWLKGDVELVAHLGSFPGAVQELASLKDMMTDIGTLAAVANLDNGSLSIRGWLEGKRGGPVGDAFAAIPPATLIGESAGATNLFHIRTPWALLVNMMGLPPQLQLVPGSPDLRADLIDNFTGEGVTYSRGKEFLAEHVTLAMKDPAKGARAIEFLCDIAIQSKKVPGLKKGAGSCTGTLKLKELLAEASPELKPFVEGMPAIPIAVQVTGQNLELKVGWPGAAGGATGDMAGSDIARELMTGNWNFVMWGMGFDPLAVAPGPLQKKLTGLMAQGMRGDRKKLAGLAMMRWLYGHVYDAGVAWALRDDGMYLLAQVTTYAGDPPDAQAAHEQALTAMVKGDYGAYKALSARVAKSHPQSLAGKHGKMVDDGVSMLGQFGVWGIGMFSALVAGGKKDEARIDAYPEPMPATPSTPGMIAPGLPTGGASAADPAMDKLLEKFADEVCKCKDMACFQKKGMEFGMKMKGKQPNMQSPKAMAAMQKMSLCAQKLAQ